MKKYTYKPANPKVERMKANNVLVPHETDDRVAKLDNLVDSGLLVCVDNSKDVQARLDKERLEAEEAEKAAEAARAEADKLVKEAEEAEAKAALERKEAEAAEAQIAAFEEEAKPKEEEPAKPKTRAQKRAAQKKNQQKDS